MFIILFINKFFSRKFYFINISNYNKITIVYMRIVCWFVFSS